MGVQISTRRAATAAVLLILGGCSQAGRSGGQAQDRFAGLDAEILKWRAQIIATDPLCKSQAADQKCQGFEVACKAERVVTPADQAGGVTAHVVTAITWEGFDPKFKHSQSGTRAAEFTKTASGWTRADHAPINMSSCADL
ncbi:MAG: hypothetical protein ACHP9T_06775 [Caulobacterales bacterium]|jgi:hypothetical protein